MISLKEKSTYLQLYVVVFLLPRTPKGHSIHTLYVVVFLLPRTPYNG